MGNRVWVIVLILALVLGSAVGSLAFAGRPGHGGWLGGRKAAGNDIGIVYITGTIAAGGGGSNILSEAVAGSDEITAELQDALTDPAIKAVVLRINSPGGSAAASQEIGQEVQRLRKAGKKVVVSMADVAASGAYWVSAGADYIMANPATETGSIGVIMEMLNYGGLYKKLGLQEETIKSAAHKDIGSPTRPMTPEERDILQGMVDDIYQQFIAVVAQGRHLPVEKVQELADGRVYTGRQAKDLGLVDGLGNFQDAVDKAAELAGIRDNYSMVDMQPVSPLQQFLQDLGVRSKVPSLVGGLKPLGLPSGGGPAGVLGGLIEGGTAK